VERRKEVRRLAIARGSLENDRLKRLRKLSDVLYRFRNLDIVARGRTAELLQKLHPDKDIPASAVPKPSVAYTDQAEPFVGHLPVPISGLTFDDEREALFLAAEEELFSSPSTTTSSAERELVSDIPPSTEFPSADDSTVCDTSRPEDAPCLDVAALVQFFEDKLVLSSDQKLPEEIEDLFANDITPHVDESMFLETEFIVREISPLPAQSDHSLDKLPYYSTILSQEPEDMNSAFTSLYFDFRQSISKLAFLAARETSALAPLVLSAPSDPDTQAEIVMTKAQYQLTLEERELWEQLVSSPSTIMDSTESEFSSAVETTLANLTRTSNVMFESYQRRSNPPTTQTYEESKRIIEAMGVPCIDSVGPFEAEALASSIVLNGLADYVASEDTVRMPILSRNTLS
jgi:flap endonuclease-1